jgi:hypothetical protein
MRLGVVYCNRTATGLVQRDTLAEDGGDQEAWNKLETWRI